MVAEMADFACSLRTRSVIEQSDGCGDDGICVFRESRQFVLAS